MKPLIIVLGLSLVCLTGCASTRGGSAAGKADVSVGAADAGRVIELKVGQLLLVQLPASTTSHRTWQMLRKPAELVLMPDEKRFDQTEQERADHESVGLEQLRFRAVGPGETIVSLALVRPGLGLSPSDERWMLQVVVQ